MKSVSVGTRIFTALALLAPVLYFTMYLPIWGGEEWRNDSELANSLLIFQGVGFVCAVIHTPLVLKRKTNAFLSA